jgi:uncharacterized membrane-anchored protein
MSDKHGNSRKGLMVNSALFVGADILLAVSAFTATDKLSTGVISLLVGIGIGVPFMLKAWKSFSNLEYGETMKNGIISWIAPAGVALLNFLL